MLELTIEHTGDASTVPVCIASLDALIGRVIADGACDGQPFSEFLTKKFGRGAEVKILLPFSAALGLNEQRDAQIHAISDSGSMVWQKEGGYNQRSKPEAQIGRWKLVIGTELHSWKLVNYETETHIAARALNRMTADGRAIFECVA